MNEVKVFDNRKLCLIAFICIIIAIIAFFVIKGMSKTNEEEKVLSESDSTAAINYVNNYVTELTEGYTSDFSGQDYIFGEDKYSYSDLTTASILNTAIKYIDQSTSLNNGVSTYALETLNSSEAYGNIYQYAAYNGTSVRQAIKELFNVDFVDTEVVDEPGFAYNIYYNSTYDIYLYGQSTYYTKSDSNYKIETSTIKTTKVDDTTIKVYIAVAYIYKDSTNNKKLYYKDSVFSEKITETDLDSTEFPTSSIDSFQQYAVTLKITGDSTYAFDNIEKTN